MSGRLTRAAALVVGAGLLPVVPSGAAATADAESCFGLAPTIVAGPGDASVLGTEGDDVILAQDVTNVTALGGDDALCLSGVGWADAGEGDDRVDVSTPGRGWVVLGSGSDLFEGSPERDRVQADEFDGEDSFPGEGPDNTDVVRTYGGGDAVYLADSSAAPSPDRVSLGPGNDRLTSDGGVTGDRRLHGGSGRDVVHLRLFGTRDGEVVLDLETGRATSDGTTFAVVADFEDADVHGTSGPLTVRATDGPNELRVTGGAAIDARGGADRITLHGTPREVLGGPGRDSVAVLGYSDLEDLPVLYDLRRRTFTRGDAVAPFAVENLTVWSTGALREDVVVLGTPGADVVTMRACGGTVRGAGGDDVLRSDAEQCEGTPVTLRGGPGDDRLRGGDEVDVLVGGVGHDRAVGRRGSDRCRAEVERGCELD
ncbi:hypothetical protein QWY28_21520 [Nocardioides sp. SOB77]|uniref:Calcium-binding protein n=1 Tax=Nocardioides oceani TaxID=3058369 RepID=A0ABT8FLK6_9ACTN|nr:hypothetical protein [Nocardioides oceani]MDN4175558.1 hypothetical protein [Nocardioides oceani]